MAGGDGIEGDTVSQVIGVVAFSVLDAGAGLEDLDVLLDGPSAFVPGDDGPSGFGVGVAFAAQQPVEALLAGGSGSVTDTASMSSSSRLPASRGAASLTLAARRSRFAVRRVRAHLPPQAPISTVLPARRGLPIELFFSELEIPDPL